jgi:2-C-methyl-D-erythritol 2,4-cyclodiphosphate synthase
MVACGIGYDVHRFAAGRPLVLGGVTIEFPLGLEGHSDADVLCHSIADALLGAAGESDIGHLFPNTDEALRGLNSVVNVDATLVAEAPKMAPYLQVMKANLAEALAVSPSRVGIKATTNEGLGFLGRGEGIAALAVASVERK